MGYFEMRRWKTLHDNIDGKRKVSFTPTRMHSSRMRTGRSLTVCCSVLPGGVLLGPRGGSPWSGGYAWSGGVLPVQGGMPGPGGFSLVQGGWSAWSWGGLPGPRGVLLGPGVVCLVLGGSAWSRGVLQRPPPLTESQTRVKT